VAPQELDSSGNTSIDAESVPLRMYTMAGLSAPKPAIFAGTPDVSSVLTTAGSEPGAPDTGGTPLTIQGAGFDQAFGPIVYSDLISGFSIGTQYSYTINSDTSISAQTVAQNPAVYEVWVCSVTGCSSNLADPGDIFLVYPPGNPVVTGVTPDSGPAAGGNTVTITGQNLGCATGVSFGSTPAPASSVTNVQALLDCGSTTSITVTVPPGTAKTTVPVTVTTVESEITGSGPSTTTADYTYTS
jgi:hypothetical protein